MFWDFVAGSSIVLRIPFGMPRFCIRFFSNSGWVPRCVCSGSFICMVALSGSAQKNSQTQKAGQDQQKHSAGLPVPVVLFPKSLRIQRASAGGFLWVAPSAPKASSGRAQVKRIPSVIKCTKAIHLWVWVKTEG